MTFDNAVHVAQKYFPNLQIKYKNESTFMKFLGKILFFNPKFMTDYTTTIGSTIYFTNREYVNNQSAEATTVLCHELAHVNDAQQLGKPIFFLGYLFPQLLALLSIIFLFVFGWKLALIFSLFVLPFPAYFRMLIEKRGYFVSLYVVAQLTKKANISINLRDEANRFTHYFKDASYYFMWPFTSIDQDFLAAAVQIEQGQKPFTSTGSPDIFTVVDEIIANS